VWPRCAPASSSRRSQRTACKQSERPRTTVVWAGVATTAHLFASWLDGDGELVLTPAGADARTSE
jgi:hypothetical protein